MISSTFKHLLWYYRCLNRSTFLIALHFYYIVTDVKTSFTSYLLQKWQTVFYVINQAEVFAVCLCVKDKVYDSCSIFFYFSFTDMMWKHCLLKLRFPDPPSFRHHFMNIIETQWNITKHQEKSMQNQSTAIFLSRGSSLRLTF